MKLLMTASVWEHIRHFHLPYLNCFHQLGWEIHVGCAGIPEEFPIIDNLINLPFEKSVFSVANFRAMYMLRKLIRTEKYDLIITHTTLAAFFTRIAVKKLNVRPRLVNVMHGYLFDDETSFTAKFLYCMAEKITAPETDLLLTMNQWDFDFAQRSKLSKRIESIPGMGVDYAKLNNYPEESRESLRVSMGIPLNSMVLIYVAEFSERKRQHILIKAMTRLPKEIVLVLCGRGDTLLKCQVLAHKLGVEDRVKFPGYVNNIESWYAMADVSVSSSRIEGLPFNIMEAMYMGLPVIASKIKGHTDLIIDGVNGFLFEDDFSDKVMQMFENPMLGKVIGMRGRESVIKYDLDTVIPQVMRKYLSVT